MSVEFQNIERKNEMNNKIGEKITELRKKAHLTQKQLASALNLSSAAVSKWETGVSIPDIDMIYALADFFHVSMDTLLCYTPNQSRVILFLNNQNCEHQARQALSQKGMIVCGVATTLTELTQMLCSEKNIDYLVAVTLSELSDYVSAKLNELASNYQIQSLTVSSSSEDQVGVLLDIILDGFTGLQTSD